MGVPKESA